MRGKVAKGLLIAIISLVQTRAWAFGCDYHEFLAYYWWISRAGAGEPTLENGGIFFILASTAADIRRHSGGKPSMVVMEKFPAPWEKIKWRYFHNYRGAKELVEKLFGAERSEANFGEILRGITAEDLEKNVMAGRMISRVCIDERQKWIARGWAFHMISDYIGAGFEMLERPGMSAKFYPDAVILRRAEPERRKLLDGLNDARSAFWMRLDEAAPELHARIHSLLAQPETGGEILGNFAFVMQRAYDSCGADDLGMKSTMERAQKVMLPILNDCAAGLTISLPGLKQKLGWGVPEGYEERERYAREKVISLLFRRARKISSEGAEK